MSFWKKRKPQHPPASSFFDNPVSDQQSSGPSQVAVPSTLASNIDTSSDRHRQQIIDISDTPVSPETTPSSPVGSSPSSKRLSRFNFFRRNSSKRNPEPPTSSNRGETSSKSNPNSATNMKTPTNSEPPTLSPQPRPRTRTPSASPRTSIYGALSSPSSSSNRGEIFERSIESVPSVSTQPSSVKNVHTHQVLEDIIPPALEATAATFTDHVNPDNVEIVTFSEVQSSDSRSNAGSPVPSSPILSAPTDTTQNTWETETSPSPDLDGKKRTLSLMSAVDHLADEIIHPAVPASVEKRGHPVSPLSLSPAIAPADLSGPRGTMAELSMERSQSQASTLGEQVVVMKQTMGDALRHQKVHLGGSHSGDVSPIALVTSPPLDAVKKDENESNSWS